MQISFATMGDIRVLRELLEVLFTQEAEFTPDPVKQAAGLRRIIEDPESGQILVLRDGTHVIGMVNLLYTVSTALGARVAILEDVIVHPESRGHGAGTQLLQAAIRAAREAGCRRITLLTDCDNAGVIDWYHRNGFVRSTMVPMRLMLE